MPLLALFLIARAAAMTPGGGRGSAAWLRQRPVTNPAVRALDLEVPRKLVLAGRQATELSAGRELEQGWRKMLGKPLHRAAAVPASGAIVLGTPEQLRRLHLDIPFPRGLRPDGYWLKTLTRKSRPLLVIAGGTPRGALYGAFALLRRMALGRPVNRWARLNNPAAAVRWVDEWDNLNGTIERGYGGRSFFFRHGRVRRHLARVRAYARLLASLGINGCVVNNVNADPRTLASGFLPQLARIADAMRPWGVQIGLAVNLNSPQTVGHLATYDPLNPAVAAWWRRKADQIYRLIPDFAGFTVKAGSEGQPGPAHYGRTHADAANVVAQALAPHHGLVLYRAFVYDNHLNYSDLKADRARAAYDIFAPLDGKFDANVILQIKYGPIDFQVREPAQPLFAALRHTNQAMELEIAQEYTGQQKQVCYLAPMWRKVLRFSMHAMPGHRTRVESLITGRTYHRPLGGMVGVVNVGSDENWLGSTLAMANLYAFGRLAWNPRRHAAAIVRQWTRLTFGDTPRLDRVVNAIELESWHVYKDYTGNLGLQTLTNITGPHYGPGPESADHNGWGQWIRAGHHGVGMNRTASGTGYIEQYPPQVARMYASLKTCPDNLLLWMHHVPYTYRLHSGETVIQHIYNRHYQGAAEAAEFPRWWRRVKGLLPMRRYRPILRELQYQAGYAIVWRDYICNYFHQLSGIPDALGRVGHHPHRIEAEAMRLEGYQIKTPFFPLAASGGKYISCPRARCTASFVFHGRSGRYRMAMQYFDPNFGTPRFEVFAGRRRIANWTADRHFLGWGVSADNSTRKVLRNVELRRGETIRIVGIPNGRDTAAVDYISLKARR